MSQEDDWDCERRQRGDTPSAEGESMRKATEAACHSVPEQNTSSKPECKVFTRGAVGSWARGRPEPDRRPENLTRRLGLTHG